MNVETTSQKLVNGLLLEQTIEFLKTKKGENAVSELEKSLGPFIFDQYRMYPVEQLILLQREVVKSAFGSESDEGYYILGKNAFDKYAHTLVGATLTNISSSPIEVLKKIQDIWNSVVNFGTRKLIEADEVKGKAIIEIADDPRNYSYLRGVIEGGLNATHVINPSTKIIYKDNNKYDIEITWQP
ncbi:DUF2378 family protein [Candidatus Gottesmanbacteria bacterium]|nr:DUF2378 family protein [Candidatus Gottesmanbacteria bacterium]